MPKNFSLSMSPSGPLPQISLWKLFLAFLLIGMTSFGGGVVAYLRNTLVIKNKWFDEDQFLELLAISQTLPGLNTTNMAILGGDRLRGVRGSIVCFCGIIMPGAILILILGIFYAAHAQNPHLTSILKGIAASAVGLLLAVTLQLGNKQWHKPIDVALIVLTFVLIDLLHWPLWQVILSVGTLAVFWFRPRKSSSKS